MIRLNSKASEKSGRKMQECLPLAWTATSLTRYFVQTCDQIAFQLRLNKPQMIVINHNLVYDKCFVNETAVWVWGLTTSRSCMASLYRSRDRGTVDDSSLVDRLSATWKSIQDKARWRLRSSGSAVSVFWKTIATMEDSEASRPSNSRLWQTLSIKEGCNLRCSTASSSSGSAQSKKPNGF